MARSAPKFMRTTTKEWRSLYDAWLNKDDKEERFVLLCTAYNHDPHVISLTMHQKRWTIQHMTRWVNDSNYRTLVQEKLARHQWSLLHEELMKTYRHKQRLISHGKSNHDHNHDTDNHHPE